MLPAFPIFSSMPTQMLGLSSCSCGLSYIRSLRPTLGLETPGVRVVVEANMFIISLLGTRNSVGGVYRIDVLL